MSFSVSANGGQLEWMGGGQRLAETLNGVFAQRGNLLSVPFWSMLRDMHALQPAMPRSTARPAGCAG